MLKNKTLSAILAVTVAAGILAGCSSKPATTETKPAETKPAATETKPAETKPAETKGAFVDGTYKAEVDKADERGYTGKIEVTIAGGKITAVKFDEVKADGTGKSTDEAYKAAMEPKTKTYPAKVYSELAQKVIDKQSADIDTVSGATGSSTTFKTLAKYVLENMAKDGKTTTAKVTVK